MAGQLAPVDLVETRAAIAAVGARVSALLRAVIRPDAVALGVWTTTDVAVHISHSMDVVTSLVRGTTPMTDDIWQLSTLTNMLVAGESERDLVAIATRIDASVAALLGVLREYEETATRSWVVDGVEFPLSAVGCHALNELVVHGADIARADGAPWPVDRDHAALVLRGFLIPSLGALGRPMVDQQRAAGVRVTYRIHLRGGGAFCLRLDDGDLIVSDDPPGPVDCHLSVDPAAFLMVSWGRTGQWSPILKGKLFAYGRKPWLGLKLRSLLRNP